MLQNGKNYDRKKFYRTGPPDGCAEPVLVGFSPIVVLAFRTFAVKVEKGPLKSTYYSSFV